MIRKTICLQPRFCKKNVIDQKSKGSLMKVYFAPQSQCCAMRKLACLIYIQKEMRTYMAINNIIVIYISISGRQVCRFGMTDQILPINAMAALC